MTSQMLVDWGRESCIEKQGPSCGDRTCQEHSQVLRDRLSYLSDAIHHIDLGIKNLTEISPKVSKEALTNKIKDLSD